MLKPLSVWITKTVENSSRDENTRLSCLSPETPVCRSRSNSYNQIWNNRLVQTWERNTSRLCIVIAQLVKNLPAMQETWFNSWVGKIPWRRDRLPTPVFLGFPRGSAGKESACNAEDLGSIPELGRSPGEGKGYPLQYSGLENSMDFIVHGVTKSWTQLRLSLSHVRTQMNFENMLIERNQSQQTVILLNKMTRRIKSIVVA